jgi:hypothetical protein
MKLRSVFCVLLAALGFLAVENANANDSIATKPIYVPDLSHENDHLDLKTMAWDATMKTTNVPANARQAHFVFSFTNVSAGTVTIADVHPSCGCTTAQLPPLPWGIPAG